MRAPIASLCLCLSLTLLPPAVAMAETSATLTPKLSPNRLGASTSLTLSFAYSNPGGFVPTPVSHVLVRLPAGLEVKLKGLAICAKHRAVGNAGRGCPAASRVGRGSALAAGRIGAKTVQESASLTAYRDGEEGIAIVGVGLSPLEERVVVNGTVEPAEAPYGLQLGMSVPPIATLPTEPNASLLRVSLTLSAAGGAGHGSRGILQMPRSCPAGGFPFAASFVYADGSSSEATAKAPCP